MDKSPKDIIENFIDRNARLVTERPDIAQSQAGTESESSKDYTGRVVFEFFQNAIDRAESNVWLELTENAFIISNDGEPFSIEEQSVDKYKKSDFHALNTIHNSNKKAGESVGNKGVGFKSCWNVSSHVTIESIKEEKAWGFDLFNPVTVEDFQENDNIREALEQAGKDGVPSFYFPKYFSTSRESLTDGRVTTVTIHLKDSEARKEIKKELDDFEKTKFFFLNQLKNKEDKNLIIHIRGNSILSKDENWDVIDLKSKNEFNNELQDLIKNRKAENYANIPLEPNIAIAFPPDNFEDIDSKFYTYLPTKAECGFNILIHADFALDNARVSIPDNKYNNKILEISAKMLVSELLHNNKYHNYESFSQFLIPKHRDDKFAKLVWDELIKDNNLTYILQKVFTKDMVFPEKSYRLIFDAISNFTIHRGYGEWKDGYYNKVYNDTIRYFCNENIFIVYIDDNYVSCLPTKDKDEDSQKNKLFYIDEEKNESKYNFTLLKDLNNITLSSMNDLNRDVFIKNNIVKENRNIEIYRALAIEMERDVNLSDNTKLNILEFLEINSGNYINIEYFEKDTVKRSSKAGIQLARINLPIKNGGWQAAKKCFFNIPKEVSEKFVGFYEVDFEKLKYIFKSIDDLKYFGAWNTIPITEAFELPWSHNNVPQVHDSEFKILLQNSIIVWKKIEEISKDNIKNIFLTIGEQKIFFDEVNETFCSPNEVFLFNDERKRKGINQVKKDDRLRELYESFQIYSIEDTRNSNKLLLQLNKIKDLLVDKAHKTMYKQLILSLSKIKDIDILKIPLLSNSHYVNSLSDIWFADRNTKRYKHYFKDLNFVEFDIETNKDFVRKVGVKDFNPDFRLMPEEAISRHQSDLKREIEVKYLSDMFCIADETMNVNRFDRDEAISRWNNLQIGYAEDVWIELKLNGYKFEVGKDIKNDVLFKPLSDSQRQQNKGSIGEFIHDLEGNTVYDIIINPKFSDFGYVIADGVFRDTLLGPILSAYLKDNENFLQDKGIEKSEVDEMKIFIEQSLLSIEEKDEIVEIMRGIGLTVDEFSAIRNFEKYAVIELSFKEFENSFNDKYNLVIQDIINEYKNFIKQSIIRKIDEENTDKYLEILCFNQHNDKEYFFKQKEKILKKNIEKFLFNIDILELFDIKKLDDIEYINAKLNFEFGIDAIDDTELNIHSMSKNPMKAQGNPQLGDAKQKKNNSQADEERNEKRGIGKELKISYDIAVALSQEQKKIFVENIESSIFNKDNALREQKNIIEYLDSLKEYEVYDDLAFAQKIIQIASNKLDGLGYDLLVPKFNDNKLLEILKVEMKTTIRTNNIEIHLSKNEFDRILYFIENKVDTWQIWLNSDKNNITNIVKEEVKKFNKQESSFYAKDYILTLGIK